MAPQFQGNVSQIYVNYSFSAKDTYSDPIFFLNGGIRYIPDGRIMSYNKSFVASILSFKVAVSKARADRQPEICP